MAPEKSLVASASLEVFRYHIPFLTLEAQPSTSIYSYHWGVHVSAEYLGYYH